MEAASYTFELPVDRNAGAPPERRGVRRDRVRLLVQSRAGGELRHSSFHRLADHLRPGDCLVLNESRTIPASLKARRFAGDTYIDTVEVRLAKQISDGVWEALLLETEAANSSLLSLPSPAKLYAGETLRFASTLTATVERRAGSAFATLHFNMAGPDLFGAFYELGEPIRYEYTERPWQLDYYQTVYGTVPGSVEMPSAGRAFSWELLFGLRLRGVRIAYVQLHTGLSYLYGFRLDPAQNAESYAVSLEAAEAINRSKSDGGRIIAVGTTVVRCLEAAAGPDGVQAGAGQTSLYINESYPLRVTDGLISGFHEPEASHLHMLSAFIGLEELGRAYDEAIRAGYLWHEFGDVHLML
ncbi:S-adenosylmethionine:tRNA ribosyltransferase-isomerase [Paenibacillus ginsengarvi]|uniref:S-adenosylmethionine:tRNA ribosyltransferase-isomerase n=1 Tax=Paenibacillus ginsengarvi TaxID=400777 RepID=A0A3B0CII6_9BACL|nr:S-adenosylmethionine:tRNA ribosyltransferase-isomerase [Paenibacillus ginsengarvi]RKN85173.1 S-adenosylmethionine:tRNA ribosyltransferase-isomerase [Paenibacillus ginsengarvi]